MNFTSIISWLLWCGACPRAPVQWLEGVVGKLVSWALPLLEDEDQRAWLDDRPANAAWFGGWLAIIEARIDELIEARAFELLGRPWLGRDVPAHLPLHSLRSASHCVERFLRLIEGFAEAERLAHRRAEKLARLFDRNPFDMLGALAAAMPQAGAAVSVSSVSSFAPGGCIAADQRVRAPP